MEEKIANYLITYDADDGYILYTETFERCRIELTINGSYVFSPRSVDAEGSTDPAAFDERCVRFLTRGNYHTESFIIPAGEITDALVFYVQDNNGIIPFNDSQLNTLITADLSSGYPLTIQTPVHALDENNCYVIENLEDINYTITYEKDENQVIVNILDDTTEDLKVQIAYWEAAEFEEGLTYHIEIVEEESGEIIASEDVICEITDNLFYIGDYDYFMERGDSEEEQDIYEIEVESGFRYGYTEFISSIEFTEGKIKKYRIQFAEEESELEEWTCISKQATVIDTINDKGILREITKVWNYIGDLSIFDENAEHTNEPFLIVTGDAMQYLPCLETEVYEDEVYYALVDEIYEVVEFPVGNPAQNEYYRYVQVAPGENMLYMAQSGTYTVILIIDNLIEVPQLVGAALLSMGNYDGIEMSDHYGIGINSSDEKLALPPRAISLFETKIDPTKTEKVSYNYRGLLGTLPSINILNKDTIRVDETIYQYMENTQGIYTDNMYIGDKDQYVAYYKDNNGEGKLDVKGTIYVGNTALDEVVAIGNGTIDLGKPNGFHIFIDARTQSDNKTPLDSLTYGIGFYEGARIDYEPTTDLVVVEGKDYYIYNSVTSTYEKIENPTGNPMAQHWYQRRDVRVAYINNNKLSIPYTVVLNGMDLGDYWRWELQEDTKNLTLKWMG